MGRRRSSVQDFFDGFNQTYSAISKVRQDMEAQDIANAKPENSEGYNSADGQQLEAMAKAKDENGKPYYTIGTNEQGKYTVTPNMAGEGSETGKPIVMPHSTRTTFLGKTYDKPLSEAEISRARDMAMVGVLKKYNNHREAGMMERALKADDRAEKADQRAAVMEQRTDREYERQEAERNRLDDIKTRLQEWDANSPMAQGQTKYQADLAEYTKRREGWQANYDAGDRGPKLGIEPVAPTKPSYTYLDQLHHNASRLSYRASLGDYDPTAMLGVSKALEDVKKEGTLEAARALQAGDRDGAIKAFNRVGLQLDPKDILEFGKTKVNIGGAPMDTYFLNVRGPNGEVIPYNAAMILHQFNDTDKMVNQYYAGRADQRGQASLALQKSQYDDGKTEKKAVMDARGNLYKAENPTATPQQVEAVRQGVVPAVEPTDGLKPEVRHDPTTGVTSIVQADRRGNVSVTNVKKDGSVNPAITLPSVRQKPGGAPAAAPGPAPAPINGAPATGKGEQTVGKSPYPEGHPLTGVDGVDYVVRNGKPVVDQNSKTSKLPAQQPSRGQASPAASYGTNAVVNKAKIADLEGQLQQANAQLAAAAQSGDVKVTTQYAQRARELQEQIQALQ